MEVGKGIIYIIYIIILFITFYSWPYVYMESDIIAMHISMSWVTRSVVYIFNILYTDLMLFWYAGEGIALSYR